jgi:hypothetical protein
MRRINRVVTPYVQSTWIQLGLRHLRIVISDFTNVPHDIPENLYSL